MAGVPYELPKVMPDAMAFFKSQREVDEKVAKMLEELHQKRAKQVNAHRREPPPLEPGQKVWWLRPRGRTGEKLESYWVGPSVVRKRVGEHSYMVEVAEGRTVPVHRCHLKPHVEDELMGKPVRLFQYKQAVAEADLAPDEWLVETIKAHRRTADGEWEFLVKWQDNEQCTWEPLGHFFHQYAEDFVNYCRDHHLRPDVVDHLLRHPAEVAVLKQTPVMVQVVRAIQEVLADGVRAEAAGSRIRIWEEPPDDWPAVEDDEGEAVQEGKMTEMSEQIGGHQEKVAECKQVFSAVRVSHSTTEDVTIEMRTNSVQKFNMQSGQAAYPPPGTQGNRHPKRPLEAGAGGAVGPPGAPSPKVLWEPEKETNVQCSEAAGARMPLATPSNRTSEEKENVMEAEQNGAHGVQQQQQQATPGGRSCVDASREPEYTKGLARGTAFHSGAKSRTRSRGSQPTPWP